MKLATFCRSRGADSCKLQLIDRIYHSKNNQDWNSKVLYSTVLSIEFIKIHRGELQISTQFDQGQVKELERSKGKVHSDLQISEAEISRSVTSQ